MSSLHQARSGLGVAVVGGMVYAIGGKGTESLGARSGVTQLVLVFVIYTLGVGTPPFTLLSASLFLVLCFSSFRGSSLPFFQGLMSHLFHLITLLFLLCASASSPDLYPLLRFLLCPCLPLSPHPMISCLPQPSSLLPISPSPLPLSSPHLRPLTHQDQALPVHQLWPPSALWCLMMMLLVGYAITDCVRATGTAGSAPCKSFHSMWWGQSLHFFYKVREKSTALLFKSRV